MEFTRHYVKAMDESMIQKCIFCGVTILDESDKIISEEEVKEIGFREGEVFISKNSKPEIWLIQISEKDRFTDCIPR